MTMTGKNGVSATWISAIFSRISANFCQFSGRKNASAEKTVEKQGLSVAANGRAVAESYSHKNKGFALVCSLLRYVWDQTEAARPKIALARPS